MIYKTARQKNLSGSSVDEVYPLRHFSAVDDIIDSSATKIFSDY